NPIDHSKTNLSIRTSSKSLLITKTNQTNVITLAHAVRILQAYERARQGRVHAYFMHRMKNEVKITETKLINDNHLNDSCLIIQTIWRQKYAEKLFDEKKIEQQKLLGMVRIIMPTFSLFILQVIE
ncbi:unnamed protein product, partial [Adineta steineri]